MNNQYFISFTLEILFLFQMNIGLCSICPSKSFPFLKNNNCTSFCSKLELENEVCWIEHEIVKIQYMSNIIIIGSENYRYINIDSDENKNMVILTSKNGDSSERLFYGLKYNGRFLFINYGKNIIFYHIIWKKKKDLKENL